MVSNKLLPCNNDQCLIQEKIFTSPPRAVVAPRGRRTARSSDWAILLFSDIKFNNIIITTNNYIYLLKSNSIMLQVIVHNKNNSENEIECSSSFIHSFDNNIRQRKITADQITLPARCHVILKM